MRAAKEFNLTLVRLDEGNNRMSIWDGSRFVLTVGNVSPSAKADNADIEYYSLLYVRSITLDGLPGSIILSLSGDMGISLSGACPNCRFLHSAVYFVVTDFPNIISVSHLLEEIKILYTPKIHKWSSVEELGGHLKWLQLTAQTSAEYLTGQGISELTIHEFHESMTRVNYGQVGNNTKCQI